MKKIFNYLSDFLKQNKNSFKVKLFILIISIIIFTGTDLIVKQIAYLNLKDKEDVTVISGFWYFHYVTNDDIGFSALRFIDKYLGINKKINVKDFNKIMSKLDNAYKKDFINRFYELDISKKYYILKSNAGDYEKDRLKYIFSSVNFRSLKWIILVCIQSLATIAVIFFYFKSRHLKYLIPLAIIVGGALGNVLDRIIRGHVVDYVMWTFQFIPFTKNISWLNPWPIFNLADVFTICGTILLFIIVFFTKDEKEQEESQKKNQIENNL